MIFVSILIPILYNESMIIIGHRGAMGYEPENTLRSFQKALDLGIDMIELDVHVCGSGELVVIHDEKINRTTNERGLVAQKTLSELKKLDAGQGEKIPTLEEVLNLIKGRAKVNIELKGKNTALKAGEIVKKYNMENDVIFSASSLKPLLIAQKQLPEVSRALIYISIEKPFLQKLFNIFSLMIFPLTKLIMIKLAQKAKADYIHPARSLTTKGLVKKLHELGYKINVWTVKKAEQAQKMKKLGVDGIFMNYPDKIG